MNQCSWGTPENKNPSFLFAPSTKKSNIKGEGWSFKKDMLFFWVTFGVIHIFSFLFYFLVLERVREFARPYLILENRETKLFGFVSIKQIFFLYFISILAVFFVEILIFFLSEL